MLVTEYNEFVLETDQYRDRPERERKEIALYGLVGEIGSLLSAVKKQLLAEAGENEWDRPNNEIIEELGDVIWYCFSFAQIHNAKTNVNIFIRDIALLKKEMDAKTARGQKIRAALDPSKKAEFLRAAKNFPNTKDMCFADYQNVAFLTARTYGKVLLEVCLAVLWQLGAELLRKALPESELELNTAVSDRDENTVLGKIAWHLAALASLYRLSLDMIVEENKKKASFRGQIDNQATRHDAKAPPSQRFPRQFEIAFISVSSSRARMYYKGRQLGDELTDNSRQDDGYRFHDVMHLANVAFLGWSPVLRSLMGLKRKYDAEIDEVEDGARAKIVEELVIKAIHSDGAQLSDSGADNPVRLFPNKGQVTFKLIKQLWKFVKDLEVEDNKAWEWKESIFEGSSIFYKLNKEGQGTVEIDMDKRTLAFRPEVCIEIAGTVRGLGMSQVDLASYDKSESASCLADSELATCEAAMSSSANFHAHVFVTKRAILQSIGYESPEDARFKELVVTFLDNSRVSIKTIGSVREAMWAKQIIDFKIAPTQTKTSTGCAALALSDPKDAD